SSDRLGSRLSNSLDCSLGLFRSTRLGTFPHWNLRLICAIQNSGNRVFLRPKSHDPRLQICLSTMCWCLATSNRRGRAQSVACTRYGTISLRGALTRILQASAELLAKNVQQLLGHSKIAILRPYRDDNVE